MYPCGYSSESELELESDLEHELDLDLELDLEQDLELELESDLELDLEQEAENFDEEQSFRELLFITSDPSLESLFLFSDVIGG